MEIFGLGIGALIGYGVLGLVLLGLLFDSVFIVEQQTAAIVERLGKFSRAATAGLNFKLPIIDRVAGRVSLRIRQLDVDVETKTKDNVFVKAVVSVQFFIIAEKVYEAFYKLTSAKEQIGSYVFDIVRAEVPKMDLDDVFIKKDDIAAAIKEELTEQMGDFGFGITKSLVTDIDPDGQVKAAMNKINASTRLKAAAEQEAEAHKITLVKAAEAEAESKKLQGQGIAEQRKAIINGLKDSVDEFMDSIPGSTAEDVMALVMMTQYFDTMKDIGAQSKSNTVFIPHSPGGLQDIGEQIRNGVMQAGSMDHQHGVPAIGVSKRRGKKTEE